MPESAVRTDLRRESSVTPEILQFIKEHDVRTVIMSPGIIGYPHEEGPDYPEEEPYWATRDRWTGEELPEQ